MKREQPKPNGYCIDCGTELASKRALRCMPCKNDKKALDGMYRRGTL